MRLCFEDNWLDPSYESALSQWHSLCNTFITFSPTTPPVSTITVSYDALCNGVEEACATAKLLFDQCDGSYTNDVHFTSCVCQTRFLILDYSCEYLGNTSCLDILANTSLLLGYNCPDFAAVIGTGILSDVIRFEEEPSLTKVGTSEC
jgi:hypothetical protein